MAGKPTTTTITIKVGDGRSILIDDEDYDSISQHTWYVNNDGYVATHYPDRNHITLMHNMILGIKGIDHKNGNKLDNRKSNLRPATKSQNAANRPKDYGKFTSKYKGVNWHNASGKWYARIHINGKQISLGYYLSEEEAAKAYDRAAIKYFGEYARLNFQEEASTS